MAEIGFREVVSHDDVWRLFYYFGGLVIWLIIVAIRKLSSANKASQTDNAVELLRKRYSRGEIDTEEYRQRLQELKDIDKI